VIDERWSTVADGYRFEDEAWGDLWAAARAGDAPGERG
jgi:hypothetical protein